MKCNWYDGYHISIIDTTYIYHTNYGFKKNEIILGNSSCQKFYSSLTMILEEGNGNPLQYSCLGNPMERGTWQVTVHGVI